MDLTIPHVTLPMYDWVMCLEVLEHIPAQFEDVAVFNIATHARKGLLISWAPPGQGGYHHVNERGHAYVEQRFGAYCFSKDANLTSFIRLYSLVQWVRANLIVFRRNSSCTPNKYFG